MRRLLITIIALFGVSGLCSTAASGNTPSVPGLQTPSSRSLVSSLASRAYAGIASDTTLIASWTFEDGLGGPDPQGWTPLDLSAQTDTFFHVDDFSGLTPTSTWYPLEGTRSMWCGARPCQPAAVCYYYTLPGYGNNWDQEFQSIEFSVTGDVTIDFLARFDSEPSYDFTYLEYSDGGGPWQAIAQYDGFSWFNGLLTATIPAASHSGSVRIRFHFTSDGALSDEDGLFNFDGAAILDSLTVRDANGVVDFQDFESEMIGARVTADGHWQASGFPAFGDYAGLFDGSMVLQEDSLRTNTSHLWGFFSGSPDTYACGGHPEQAAVPFSKTVDGEGVFLHNAIVSPPIDLAGVPEGDALFLISDVYLDLPPDNAVVLEVLVRSLVNGTWSVWRQSGTYAAGWKYWYDLSNNLSQRILKNATSVQVAIGAADQCDVLCPGSASGSCHTHAPLIDNIRLVGIPEVLTVTNTNTFGQGSFIQALIDASATPNAGVILFDIPGPGPHVIPLSSYAFFVSYPIVIDGTSQPGYAATPLIRLEGPQGSFEEFFRVNASSSFLGLEFTKNPWPYAVGGQALTLNQPSVVQGCAFRDLSTPLWIGTDNCLIGGVLPGEGNTFTGTTDRAVTVSTGTGNTIRGNSIYSDGAANGLGIDLGAAGVTPNDFYDNDTGPNNLQNFPVATAFDAASGLLSGSLQSTPGTTFTIDFYHSPACNPAGYGEGQTYLRSIEVTTGPYGDALFSVELASLPSATGVIAATATDPAGNTSEFGPCIDAPLTPTGIGGDPSLPRAFALHANTPNPFNPVTSISYDIPPGGADVTLSVYDVAGRLVRMLVDGFQRAGTHTTAWDGSNGRGAPVSSGVYFCRMSSGSYHAARRMVLLK